MYSPEESANLIECLAKKRGVTIDRMLKECELKARFVGNMKTGSMPSADKLAKIASYLDVSSDYLLGFTDDPTPPRSTANRDRVIAADVGGKATNVNETIAAADRAKQALVREILEMKLDEKESEQLLKIVKTFEKRG